MEEIWAWALTHGGWPACGAVIIFMFVLLMNGQIFTRKMLDELRENDKQTIERLEVANRNYHSTLPRIADVLEAEHSDQTGET